MFLRRKLASVFKEEYQPSFSQQDLEFLSPNTAKAYDELTNGKSAIQQQGRLLGDLGQWMTEASQMCSKKKQRALGHLHQGH